jgi:folate-dependent phosphoribosylglycinamide formyltransferase PurN
MTIGILISGRGSNMTAILDAVKESRKAVSDNDKLTSQRI